MQQVPLGEHVDVAELDTLRAAYDTLFELVERSGTKVGKEVHDG